MKFRIHIREQLCLLIALTNVVALTVLTVSVWFQTVQYMRNARKETLTVTANLKASQIAQATSLFRDSVRSISTRENLQSYVGQFNHGNHTDEIISSMEVSGTDASLMEREWHC
jgi:sensor histidine kinase regulating citrate/malate metabolism